MRINVLDFKAKADGVTLNTKAIQNAIDYCSENGGGIVEFPNGIYLTGTIYFKTGVTLELEVNATILGSTNIEDYTTDTHRQMYAGQTMMDGCLIYAHNCENIGIKGKGTIDGQGGKFGEEYRPMMLRWYQSTNIRLESVRLVAPGSWTNAFIECDNIWVDGIDIYSRAHRNGDGVDFDACTNVFVSNSKFDCSDDCICFQNSCAERKCKDAVVTNCVFCSKYAGIRIGLLSYNDIENIAVSNCTFKDINCSGLKIQSSEGAALRNMSFTNLVMENVTRPMFITINKYRERVDIPREIPTTCVLEDMIFSNIICNNVDEEYFAQFPNQPQCITIDSIDGAKIRNINISNVFCKIIGKPDFKRSTDVIPTFDDVRAECFRYLEDLPAYGVFARNVEGLTLNNVIYKTVKGDSREERVFINVD